MLGIQGRWKLPSEQSRSIGSGMGLKHVYIIRMEQQMTSDLAVAKQCPQLQAPILPLGSHAWRAGDLERYNEISTESKNSRYV